MKFLIFTFIFLFTFFSSTSFAGIVTLSKAVSPSDCTSSVDLDAEVSGSFFRSQSDAISYLESYQPLGCKWYTSSYRHIGGYKNSVSQYTYQFQKIGSTNKKYYSISVSSGDGTKDCDFAQCKVFATADCEADNTTLNQSSYFWKDYGSYDASCNEPPPEEPIQNEEECESLSNNSCSVRGGVSDFIFTDNNDFTYECTFTCGDGTTGDENGSLANDTDGLCDPNNPNDLADCDVADNSDPDCVIGCGDAFTPDSTTEIDYDPDGTNTSDGTGTDGITTVQGDVLINEIKKLKNNNAEQIIKGSNKVVDAVDSINPNDKLSELITAVKDNKPLPSDGSGNNFNDTNIVSSINSLQQSVNQGAADTVSAIEGNSLNNVIGNSLAYDTSNFDSALSDTAQLDVRIAQGEQTLKDKMSLYKTTLTSQLSFLTPMSSGYSANNLVLSQGSYDVSWSRFSQYFSTIGTIVYALAGLISLSILFVGRF
jgi:hypothetical protein